MDAQQSTFKGPFRNPWFTRPLFSRIVTAWLAFVLAAGLWQGYGEWLLKGGGGDVP